MPTGQAMVYPKWDDGGSFRRSVKGTIDIENQTMLSVPIVSGLTNMLCEMLSQAHVVTISDHQLYYDISTGSHGTYRPERHALLDPLYISVGHSDLWGVLLGTKKGNTEEEDVAVLAPYFRILDSAWPTTIFYAEGKKEPARIKAFEDWIEVLPSRSVPFIAAVGVAKFAKRARIEPTPVTRQVRRNAQRKGMRIPARFVQT